MLQYITRRQFSVLANLSSQVTMINLGKMSSMSDSKMVWRDLEFNIKKELNRNEIKPNQLVDLSFISAGFSKSEYQGSNEFWDMLA